MLIVRPRDESVRGLAQVVKNHATSVAMCSSESESTREMQAMAAAFEKLNHRVGEILRTLDDAEQYSLSSSLFLPRYQPAVTCVPAPFELSR